MPLLELPAPPPELLDCSKPSCSTRWDSVPVLATGVGGGRRRRAGVTIIDRGGSGNELPLASAEMMMFEYWPVSALVGVPESSPVMVLKLAHAGLCTMLYEPAEEATCG